MAKYRIIITDDRFGSYKEENEVLNPLDAEISILQPGTDNETKKTLSQADALLVNLFTIDEVIIRNLKKCKIISRYGVGFDNIDVNAATKVGIWVSRVPDYCVEDVTDHTLALLLACVRRIHIINDHVKQGKWNCQNLHSILRVKGKSLGLIGYGLTGQAFHRKISCLGLADIFVFDPYLGKEFIRKKGAKSVSLNYLLRNSDYISLHIPFNQDTHHLLSHKEFSVMKKEVILINTSRGPVIDEKALAKFLLASKIALAGLDVFEEEPLPSNSPLIKIENCVLTSHMAYYSEESIRELKHKAAMNIAQVLSGEEPFYPVNRIS